MEELVEQLHSEISKSNVCLDYKTFFKWSHEKKQQAIMNKIKSRKLPKSQLSGAKEIYYTLQSFYFAFSGQGIETVTLDKLIYPAWASVLNSYLKDIDEFNVETLGSILDDSHVKAILESFRDLCEEYIREPLNSDAKSHLHGLLRGLERDFGRSPFRKKSARKRRHERR